MTLTIVTLCVYLKVERRGEGEEGAGKIEQIVAVVGVAFPPEPRLSRFAASDCLYAVRVFFII